MLSARNTWLLAAIVLSSSAAWGNGLCYQLPADGAKVVYAMEATELNEEESMKGTLSIASVGQATHEGEKCRWIEFSMTMQHGDDKQRTITAKLLIPEIHIGQGKAPYENAKKVWLRFQQEDARELNELKSRRGGPLPVFLPGPLANAKKLDADDIDSPLGKLNCAGEQGEIRFKQGDVDIHAIYETRLNDKIPFGVAAAQMVIRGSREGKPREHVELTLKLKSVAKNAKSLLPDNN